MIYGTPPQIFLSYAKEDRAHVEKLYHRLKREGYKPWLDLFDLLPGQHWEQEIPNALRASDFIILFFSSTSVSKQGYVQKEFKLALEILDNIPNDRICVIPVRLDECIVPEKFSQLQICNFQEKDGYSRILRSIDLELQNQAKKHGRRVSQTQLGFFQKATNFWSGHNIVALGQVAVGKSTFLSVLITGALNTNTEKTLGAVKTSGNIYRVNNLEVKVAPTFDVSGEKFSYPFWHKIIMDADIVLYLVFANRLMQNDSDTMSIQKVMLTK